MQNEHFKEGFLRSFQRSCQQDGIGVRSPGGEIGKLISLGFIEISRANGHDSIARVTPDGLKALVLSHTGFGIRPLEKGTGRFPTHDLAKRRRRGREGG